MGLRDLLTMAEVALLRRGQPIPKGPTRLEARVERDALRIVDDRQFRADVWERDGHKCRCCGRKVLKTISRVSNRGEVHHLHGRLGDLRHETRAALLLCLEDHERCTGKVNERVDIVGTKTFQLHGETYTDARSLVTFRRVA